MGLAEWVRRDVVACSDMGAKSRRTAFGEFTFGELTFGEMTFGELTFGELTFGEMTFAS